MTIRYEIKEVELWFIIKKIIDEQLILYRNWKNRDSKDKFVKTYYFKDEALSALMIAKRCWKSE